MKNIRIMLVAAALASSAISSCSLASEGFKIPTRTNKERVVVGAAIGSSVLMLGGMGLAGKYLTKALDAMTVEQIDNIASGLATLYHGAKSAVPGVVVGGLTYAYVPGVGNKEATVLGGAVAGLKALPSHCDGHSKKSAFLATGLAATGSYIANPYIAQVLPKYGNKIKNNGPDYQPGFNWSREKGIKITL